MEIVFIVAVAENGVIGANGAIPWRVKSDMQRFKALTIGKPVVMGRKTFESIGKPLPGRPNIVITRNPQWGHPDILVANSIGQALDLARLAGAGDEVMVIGGAEIFNAVAPLAQRLYYTEVKRDYDGDAFFSKPDPAHWREVSREEHAEGINGDPAYAFLVLEKLA